MYAVEFRATFAAILAFYHFRVPNPGHNPLNFGRGNIFARTGRKREFLGKSYKLISAEQTIADRLV
jgi:hypothetical protein